MNHQVENDGPLSDAANHADQWIAVSERLPPIGREVLVYCPRKVESGRNPVTALSRFIPYEGATDYWWDNNYPGKGNMHAATGITHWMELPQPPLAASDSSTDAQDK